jgi:hypothetical protein
MATSQPLEPMIMDQLTFLSEEPPVSPSASQDSEADWMTTVVTWHSNIFDLLNERGPYGWYGRTSPASCQTTTEGTLVPFSGAWSNSGMGSPIECLTLNTSEFHNGADASLLSDILQDSGSIQQRYFLSAKACAGILRRTEKGGRTLPQPLRKALEEIVGE